MKASKYNFIFKYDDDNHIFYNSFSNALALVENESYEKYDSYIKDNKDIDDQELFHGLVDSNFLIEDDFDESKSIKLSLYKNRFDKRNLSLVIAPTTNCNFDCTYCYEKNSSKESKMTPLVQERIIDVCEQAIKNGTKRFDILWYGGEPLLTVDIIKDMSKRIIDMCDKNKVIYSAGMISNGYNLDEKVCAELEDCRLSNIQITLDGARDIHDSRRGLLGGGDTFDEIVKNIKIACEKYHVTVRINVDSDNHHGLDELIQVFEDEGLKGKIEVYLGFVENNNECYTKGNCMTKRGFSKSENEFLAKLYDRGITKYNPWLTKYPNLVSVQCIADSVNGLVISPSGDLYKCVCDIGFEDQKIGNIMKYEELTHNNTLFKYLLYDPTEDDHCKNCKILPICMGGCFKSREGSKDQRCSILKYNLKEYLIENARIINEKK